MRASCTRLVKGRDLGDVAALEREQSHLAFSWSQLPLVELLLDKGAERSGGDGCGCLAASRVLESPAHQGSRTRFCSSYSSLSISPRA